MEHVEDIQPVSHYTFRGNCKPSGFSEYDSLTGYVVKEYTVEWTDRDGTRYRKHAQIINLGRPDRGIPVDPDALLERVEIDQEHVPTERKKLWEANKKRKEERDRVLAEKIQAYLQEHGPKFASHIARGLGCNSINRVLGVLRRRDDLFVCSKKNRNRWRLVGQPDRVDVTPQPTPIMKRIREVLETHGPLSAKDITERLGVKSQDNVALSLRRFTDWFHVVEVRPQQGAVPATRIWGLVGVHKKEAA